jgi:hypothetical protein
MISSGRSTFQGRPENLEVSVCGRYLVDRWPMLGGLATMGGVNTWHTSNLDEEYGFGLTQELIERLRAYDGVDRRSFPDAIGHGF